MKKVWIINHYAVPPSLGGINRHYYFYKYMKDKGYDVTLFASSQIHNSEVNMIPDGKEKWREVECDGVPYTFVRTGGYKGNGFSRIVNMLAFPLRMRQIYKKFDPPEVIYTSSPNIFASAEALRIAKKLKVPSIFEVRDLWPESIVVYNNISRKNPAIRFLYWLEKSMYRRADRIIFTFPAGVEYLREKKMDELFSLDKVYSVCNGVDLKEFNNNKSLYPVEDSDLSDKSFFNVVYTGSIRRANQVLMLVEVAKILRDRGNTRYKLLIWGNGGDVDTLKEMIQGENLQNIVYKGFVERNKIASILSQSDASLMHGKQSGLTRFGMSLNKMFDYFAAGRPVIATFKAAQSPIDAYEAGVTTADNSPEAIADAIERMANLSPDEYARYCANALRAAQDYDYENLTDQIISVIEGMEPKK